ncbi:MAG: hypothetical protein EP326_07910, partial [Deltaproteobacteria bacterium]
MAIPNFLKEMNKQKEKNKKSNKGDFREKCLHLLDKLKNLNEERYNEMNKVFHDQYNKINIQKKKILGFYAQLKNEIKTYQDTTNEVIKTTKKKVTEATDKAIKKAEKKI